MCKASSHSHCSCGHNHAHGHTHGTGAGQEHGAAWRTWLPLALSVTLLAWGLAANPLPALPWLIFVLAYLPVGLPILKEAWEEIRRGDVFNEFTLMLIATLGAFAIGEYPEAVAVLLFYSVGEYFQDRAVERAQRDIRALVSLRPEHATVLLPDGSRVERSPEAVRVGEVVEVKAGGRLPLDGTLLTARADLDTAALTGEAEPRSLVAGDEVAAGMIALGRVVTLRVTRVAADSALQRILNLVQDAAARKSHAEMFIRRFARVYTPVVIALAALVAVVPPLIAGSDWAHWLYAALVFLVISCPCALVVSIPLGYFRGIGVASQLGILFKGGNYLDAVTRLRCVVFDKTGTLTMGRFALDGVEPAQGFSSGQVLQAVAALERRSTHPVGRAIVEAAASVPQAEASEVEELAGFGLRGRVGGVEVLAGRAELLAQCGVALPDNLSVNAAATSVLAAIGGRFAGLLTLSDRPRTDAPETVHRLRALGVERTAVLSGDRSPVVEALAERLGIAEAHGDLLPEGKVAELQRLKAATAPYGVAFVGDGINDAPVLALADVSFAMGGAGADAAVETADVVIQSDAPSRVADAIAIGRLTRRIVHLNIALALGVKVAVLLAGALGAVSLWAAVLADTGVALLCVALTYCIRAPRG